MNSPRYFRHFKGNYYKLLHYANDCETDDRLVVYKAMYGEGKVWVRPEKNFFEEIERDGKVIKRFTEVPYHEIEIALEKPFSFFGVGYPDPSFMEWRQCNINDIPLTEEEYAVLRKSFSPGWDCRYTVHAYKQNIYIIRSGFWVGKIIYRKGDDELYHITESYSNGDRLDEIIFNEMLTSGTFETDAVRKAYFRAKGLL